MDDCTQRTCTDHEADAADRLFRLKWPAGFECPACNHRRYYPIRTRRHTLYECASCGHQTSLTVGTIMEGSRTPLWKWFTAIDLVARMSKGTTAVELAAAIQVTYKTAWLILHKIRHALGQYEDRQQLTGNVRMNHGKYGHPYNPTVYRHPQEHPLLAAVSLSEEGEVEQLKIKSVEAAQCYENTPTDRAREMFARQYIDHHAVLEGLKGSYAANRHPLIRNVCAQAGKWLNAAYHGLGGKHLNAYLDEYCCRLNLSISAPAALSERLADICASFRRITYSELVLKPYASVIHPSIYLTMNRYKYDFPFYSPNARGLFETA